MAYPVVHFEVLGKDAKKLQGFYGAIFGWKIDANNPMSYGIVQKEGEGIGGGIATAQGGEPWVTFYVQVPDLPGTLKKIESMGGKTIVPITEIPNMVTFAVFADPEGNKVGIVKG